MEDSSQAPAKEGFNASELILAGVLMALGLYAILTGAGLGVGTVARMGPGFFPCMLGVILMGLAVMLVLEQRYAPKTVLAMPWRPFLLMLIALSFWAWAIKPLGLAPATFGLIVISSIAERPFRPIATLVMAVILSGGGVLLFIHGFRLPMTAFNW